MGVFRRIRDIGTATAHDWLERAEDPLRWMDRRMKEVHRRLVDLEQLERQCLLHERLLRRRLADAEALAEKRRRQEELAMKAEEEDICRLALAEQLHYEEKCRKYTDMLADWEETRKAVERQLSDVRSEYETLLERREYYLARLANVRLQQRWYCRSQNRRPPGDVLRAMDEYITEMELQAEAWREMRAMQPHDRRIDADEEVLTAEIERLRQRMRQEV